MTHARATRAREVDKAGRGSRRGTDTPARDEPTKATSVDAWSVAAEAPAEQVAQFDGAIGQLHAAIDHASGRTAVQLRGATSLDAASVHAAAARGTRGAGGAMPHGERIQRAFGRHALGGIRAHVGGRARDAVEHMGAEAFAVGDAVAFRSAPSLHTAAHEAAHVIQQRAGVSLGDGVGRAGDRYEQHADRVADAVVAGKSAEPLLDQMAGGRAASHAASRGIQFAGQGKSQAPSKAQAATWQKLSKQAFDRRVWCAEIAQTYGFALSTAGLIVTAIENSGPLWLASRNAALAHALTVVIRDATLKYPRAPWLVEAQVAKIAQWARRFGNMAAFVTKWATAIKVLGAIGGAAGLVADVAGVIGGTDAVVASVSKANLAYTNAKAAKKKLKDLKATDAWIQATLAKQVNNQLKSGDEATKGIPRQLIQGIYGLRTSIDSAIIDAFEMVKEIVNYAHGLIGAASGAAQLASLISPATMATLGVAATVVSIVNYLVQNLKLSSAAIDFARDQLKSTQFNGKGLVTTIAGRL